MNEIRNDAYAIAWILGIGLAWYWLILWSSAVGKWLLNMHNTQVRTTDRCKPLSRALAPVIRQEPVRKPFPVERYILED